MGTSEQLADWRGQLEGQEEELRELFALYGKVMFKAQMIERSIAVVVVAMEVLFATEMSEEEIAERFEEVFRQPWGALMGLLADHQEAGLEPDLHARLLEAKSTRNMLAHRFFMDRFLALLDQTSRPEMVAALQQADEVFEAVAGDASAVALDLAEQIRDVTAQDIQTFSEVVAGATVNNPGISHGITDWAQLNDFIERVAATVEHAGDTDGR